VALVCPHCAAANRPNSLWCAFCHAPLRLDARDGAPSSSRHGATAPVAERVAVAAAAPSSEPQWRQEVSRKVDAYRVRTGQRPAPEPQPHLPFPGAAAVPAAKPAAPHRPRQSERRGSDRLQIFVDQPGLDFPSGTIPSPNHALVPVAGIARRAYAWLIDVGFVVACWGMFLGLLSALGVTIATSKLAVAICLVILFLLYTQYFALFTAFGGTTPGMRIARLRVVSFDGNPPTPRQLLWRSLGYLISGGACFLGFLWALWDDDRLCWQDRTSQTYLTALPPVSEQQPAQAQHSGTA
jgi:uncharacterized RDD family membrane protein YckC